MISHLDDQQKLMKTLYPFLNPLQWIKASGFAKQNQKYDKSSYDLELYLYSQILTNNMLHYGYFEDIHIKPETISFQQFEDAQIRYAENILEHVKDTKHPVLDVGCGMGGLSKLLSDKGLDVESLTPNKNQIEFINQTYTQLVTHHSKYETFKATKSYGTVINSESLQYISLQKAFEQTDKIILPHGRWIVIDYFSLNKTSENQRPHHLDSFFAKAKQFKWSVTYERDITQHILPTLAYADMYVNRFLKPARHFAYEKLRYKLPKLFYLSAKLRESIDRKIEKELKTVNPEIFKTDRKYVLIVLDKLPA